MSDTNDFGFMPGQENISNSSFENSVGVVKIGKREYAVGLLWNKTENTSGAASEARSMALNLSYKAQYFCITPGSDGQFGLGQKELHHRAGMPSLAAHVSSAKGSSSWIGLFQVLNGYYLCAVLHNGILAETDRYFDDEDDARSEFEHHLNSTNDWQDAIAPAKFSIPGTKQVNIEELLDGKPTVRLQDVSRTTSLVKITIALSATVGLIVGGMLYLNYLEELKNIAETNVIAATTKIFTPEEPIVIPPAPWENEYLASFYLDECVKQIHKFPLDIPGWNVQNLYCEGSAVAAALDRSGALGSGGGSFNWIKLMVEPSGFNPSINFAANGSGQRASVEWSMADLPKIPIDLNTLSVSKLKRAIITIMDERFVPVTFVSATRSDAFFNGFMFSFSTKEDPREFNDLISALPGAVMTSISYNVENNIWKLEGQVYEQLPLPQKLNK